MQATDRLTGAIGRLAHYGAGALGLSSLSAAVGNVTGALYESTVATAPADNACLRVGRAEPDGRTRLRIQVANRLGLELGSTAKAYADFAAAARGTALQGEARARCSNQSPLPAPSWACRRPTMLAFCWPCSRCSVKERSLPKSCAASSANGSRRLCHRRSRDGRHHAELGKMLEQGELVSTDFLPRFAAQLQRELGEAAESAGNRLEASVNRMGTAWDKLKQKLGGDLSPWPAPRFRA